MAKRAWRSVSREAASGGGMADEHVHGDDEQGSSLVDCGWHVDAITRRPTLERDA